MVRFATAGDYPAVIKLFRSFSGFSQYIRKGTILPITAASSIPTFTTQKIVVVVDNTQQIVGCMLIDEESILLRASNIYILPNKSYKKVLDHLVEFLIRYAKEENYPGVSITVDQEEYHEYMQNTYEYTASFVSSHKGISFCRMADTEPQVFPLNSKHILRISRDAVSYSRFSKIEFHNLIYIATHSGSNVIGMLDRYHDISVSDIRSNCDDVISLIEYMNDNSNLPQYLVESLSEKLVLLNKGNIAGFIAFNTTDIHSATVEITDIYIAPAYRTYDTEIFDKLFRAACRYAAKRGAKFVHSNWITSVPDGYLDFCYLKQGMSIDSWTKVIIFDSDGTPTTTEELEQEQYSSVFSR